MRLFYSFAKSKGPQPIAKIAVFNAKKYDQHYFAQMMAHQPPNQQLEFTYFSEALKDRTANLASEADAVCIFVNDVCNASVLRKLNDMNIDLVALRCAGFNNVDLREAKALGIKVVRVPAYSPEAVAEHAMALLLAVNRKIHKAYNRTREGNFALDGLLGFNLHGKTVGLIGTGRIGAAFISICKGFGMNVICTDIQPNQDLVDKYGVKFVDQKTLFHESDVISLHCPLTADTKHIIDTESIDLMKDGVYIINTGRGALIESKAAIKGLKSKKIGGLALDVYEQEERVFFKDVSQDIMNDDVLARLLTFPNVIITGHQAFFTEEAVSNICDTTIKNILAVKKGETCPNEVKL